MNIVFKNKSGTTVYTVTEICYDIYKNGISPETFVRGGYGEGNIPRRMLAKLYKCKQTGRPCLNLSGKMYAVNQEDDKLFSKKILDKADLK